MTDAPPTDTATRWPAWQRVTFRFTFAYLLLYYPVLVVHELPGFGWLVDAWDAGWSHIAPWFARHVFHIATGFPDTSDGLLDVSYSYARLACVLLFAVVATLAWSLVDRRRTAYPRLKDAMQVWLRYGLANAMFFYGLSKVLPHQFASPSLERLVEPFGETSRMTLLWSFMGQSIPYTVFCGVAECLGAALLLFRRTATLGALVVVGVMANVAMLDFSYGVFVKLFATHLLAFAILLLTFDARRLWTVLVLHGPSPAQSFPPHLRAKGFARAEPTLKTVIVASMIGSLLWVQEAAWRSSRDSQPFPTLYGIWEVDSFTRNGVESPPLATDGTRWRRLVMDRVLPDVSMSDATLWTMTDTLAGYRAVEDAARATLTLSGRMGRMAFTYARPDPTHLVLRGAIEGDEVQVSLHRADEKSMRLAREQFQWVNDHPFGGG